MKTLYRVIEFDQAGDDDLICCDASLTIGELVGMAAGFNLGVIDPEGVACFYTKDAYQFNQSSRYVILKVCDNSLDTN